MNFDSFTLRNDEKAIFSLRSLYEKYGYSQFKMSKFEEYDLYVRNKDFLVSDNIITFTDTNGKLMALKPDVTLSIIKNSKDDENALSKVYYNENVYRVSKGTLSFKEIMQVGLECIGEIDDYCIYEVLSLAAKSLEEISNDYVLDISHLGIVSEILEKENLASNSALLKCISEKNLGEIKAICGENSAVYKLISSYGTSKSIRPVLEDIYNGAPSASVIQLLKLVSLLEENGFENKVRIDFSLLSDMNYYNGIVFKGFVEGIPNGILSGGQYDKLMKKMNRKSRAIGFAVYLDMLERLTVNDKEFDVDTVILYDDASDLACLEKAVNMMTNEGKSVLALKYAPSKLKYKQLVRLQEKGALLIENNA